MFKKKYLIILLFLIIAVGAVSQVNASDVNAGDEIAADDVVEDNIISENNIDDEISVEGSGNEEMASDDSLMDEKIATEDSENVISGEVSTNLLLYLQMMQILMQFQLITIHHIQLQKPAPLQKSL